MTGLEVEALVEPVGLGPPEIGRQLDPVATRTSRHVDGEGSQALAYSVGTKVGMYMHGLELGAQAPATLKVTEDDHLAHTHDLIVHLSHHQMIPDASWISASAAR